MKTYKQLILLIFAIFIQTIIFGQNNLQQSLLDAVKSNNVNKIKDYIAQGANINAVDENNASIFLWAVYSCDIEIIKYLVQNGADYTKKGVIWRYADGERNGWYGNALGIAANLGKFEVVKFLVEDCKILVNDCEIDTAGIEKKGYWKAIHNAAYSTKANIKLIKYLIDKGANIDEVDTYGLTPLLLSYFQNNFEAIKFFVNEGANIDHQDIYGYSLLHYASYYNKTKIAEYILNKSANPDLITLKGDTPAMIVSKKKHTQILELLIGSGADMSLANKKGKTAYDIANAKNTYGKTALHVAVTNNLPKLCQILIDNNADVEAVDYSKQTPLHYAIKIKNMKLCELLISNGVDIEKYSEAGDVANSYLHLAAKNNFTDMIAKLLNSGINIHEKNNVNFTALLYAAEYNAHESVKYLLSKGANIKDTTNYAATALFMAIREAGDAKMIELLISNGAEINAIDYNGQTLLHYAIDKNKIEIVDVLLKKGVKCNIIDLDNQTPLIIAIKKNDFQSVKKLVEYGANPILTVNYKKYLNIAGKKNEEFLYDNALCLSTAVGNSEIFQFIVEKTAVDINYISATNRSLLHFAAYDGNKENAEYILNNGFKINYQSEGQFTPLLGAVFYGRLDVADLMINNGADVFAKSIDSSTIMHYAMRYNDTVFVKKLIEKGLRLVKKDARGWLPLHYASLYSNTKFLSFILKYYDETFIPIHDKFIPLTLVSYNDSIRNKAYFVDLLSKNKRSVNYKNKYGWTPLHYFTDILNFEAMKVLIKNGANVDAKSNTGDTPLHLTSAAAAPVYVGLLLKNEANPNIINNEGKTPLFSIIESKYLKKLQTVAVLMAFSADPYIRDRTDQTVIDIARKTASNEIIELLTKPNLLYLLEVGEGKRVVDRLKSNSELILQTNDKGQTLLHLAVLYDDKILVDFLVKNKYIINKTDKNGRTPLLYAIFAGNINIANTLIDNKADVNIADKNYEAPLSIAKRREYKTLYSKLISLDAKEDEQQNPELLIPKNHSNRITDIDISPNGQLMVSSSYDNSLKIWDVATRFELSTLKGHTDRVSSVEFSPDGNFILSAGKDKTIKQWEVESGLEMRTFRGHSDIVSDIKFLHHKKKFISAGNEGEIYLWNLITGNIIKEYSGFAKNLIAIDISPDDKYLIVCGQSKDIIVWDIETSKIVKRLKGHTDIVNSICFSNNGKYVLSGGNSKSEGENKKHKAILWDFVSEKPIHFFINHKSSISSTAFSKDDKFCFTGTLSSSKIKQWNVHTGKHIYTYSCNNGQVNAIEFLPDNSGFVSLNGLNKGIIRWDLNSKQFIWKIYNIVSTPNVLTISADGKFIGFTSYSDSPEIVVLSLENGKRISTIKNIYKYGANCLKFTPDGRHILSASYDNSVKMWNIKDGKLFRQFLYPANSILSLDISSDGKLLMGGSRKGVVYVWDMQSGELLHTKEQHESKVWTVDFAPSGKFALSGGGTFDTTVVVWDTKKFEIKHKLVGPILAIKAAKFTADGKFVVSGSIDRSLCLWDVTTGTLIGKYVNHTDAITSVDISADGRYIVTASNDNTIKLWDFAKMEVIQTFIGHTDNVLSVNVNVDNKTIISTSHDNTIKIWDIDSGNEMLSIINFYPNEWAMVRPDNYYFTTKKAAQYMGFKIKNSTFGFQQFDLKYNRPDLILQALPRTDKNLIPLYAKAYKKRLSKSAFTEKMLTTDWHVPEIEIFNTNNISAITNSDYLKVEIKASDTKYNLDHISIKVNGVPVYFCDSLNVRNQAISEINKSVNLKLSNGKNKITISVYNEKGAESLKKTFSTICRKENVKTDLYIVVIGVSEYKDSAYNLNYAVKDALDLMGLYGVRHLFYRRIIEIPIINKNATRKNIINAKQILMQSDVDDKVIIFVAGHGLLDENLDYYLATHDMDFSNPSAYGLKYDMLENLLDSIPARKKLMLIDACHSGEVDKEEVLLLAQANTKQNKVVFRGFKPNSFKTTKNISYKNSFELMKELFTDLRNGTGAMIISSAGGGEYAMEGDKWKNGVFTYSVIEGMTSGNADTNNNRKVSATELYNYVIKKVQELTNGLQNPTSRQENIEFDFDVW